MQIPHLPLDSKIYFFQVNFSDIQNVVLTEKGGKRRILRRSRYEGVYVDLSYSSSQTSIKASINAIQVKGSQVSRTYG